MNGDILAVQFRWGGLSGASQSFVTPEDESGGIIGGRFLATGLNWLVSLMGIFHV